MSTKFAKFKALIGQEVVLDTSAPFVYLGRLESVNLDSLVLADADVHDLRDSETTRDFYVLCSARDGIRRNRLSVAVRLDVVLSVSRLQDVVDH